MRRGRRIEIFVRGGRGGHCQCGVGDEVVEVLLLEVDASKSVLRESSLFVCVSSLL